MIMSYRQIIKAIRRCAIAGFGIISDCRILAHVFVTPSQGLARLAFAASRWTNVHDQSS
jgi:hypothetical protein